MCLFLLQQHMQQYQFHDNHNLKENLGFEISGSGNFTCFLSWLLLMNGVVSGIKFLFWLGPWVSASCSKMSHTSSSIHESSCSLAWSWARQAITSSKVGRWIGSRTSTKCKKSITGLKLSTFAAFSFEISSCAPDPQREIPKSTRNVSVSLSSSLGCNKLISFE